MMSMKYLRFQGVFKGTNKSFFIVFLLFLSACTFPGFDDVPWESPFNPDGPGDPGDSGSGGDSTNLGSVLEGGDPSVPGGISEDDASSDYGDLDKRPIGFINHGTINATVRAWTWIPLGKELPDTPSRASTVSTAASSPGLWPNPSRFISLPLGTYTFCIEWDEGDIDDDGKIDYFYYIDSDPVTLDYDDSEDLDMAKEIDISAPAMIAPVQSGKCGAAQRATQCTSGNIEVDVYSEYMLESSDPAEIIAWGNPAEVSSPPGIDVTRGGGSTLWGSNIILWSKGDWAEATTSDEYTAIGVQAHGDATIGWARVLFDGAEVWSGNTAASVIAEGRFGVYVEVRCFSPGTHTIRMETLGIDGGGGGMSVPVSYFGFRR
jgi:hypothetical protein